MKNIERRKVSRNCPDCRKRTPSSFCDLPEAVFAELSRLMICRMYTRGSAVFIEGQPSKGVYVLCTGRAKLSAYSEEGKAIILRVSEPGEVLGISAVVSGTPFEKTAHVIDDCSIGFIKRKDFIRFIETNHEGALNALRQVSGNYQKAHLQICSLGLSATVGDKLARLLLQWYDRATLSGPARISRLYTHGEMAEMIGTSRETVTRLLKDFRERGLISETKGEMCIPDRGLLKASIGSKHRNGNGHV
jgi:CRP/FNR family transcriptional regulator, cyclic AMP receptor protein